MREFGEQLAKLPVHMMKLPLNIMVSGMETATRTMQDIRQKVETPDVAEAADETEEKSSGLGALSRFAIIPVFEMIKFPVSVFVSSFKTVTETMQEIRNPSAKRVEEDGQGPAETLDREIVSLTAQEAALESETFLRENVGSVNGNTLWTIGRPGRSEFLGKWSAAFDYRIGEDLDPINCPAIPHYITVHGAPKLKGGTEKLNIHFTLDRDYAKGELALIYDRWGGEKDEVLVDGNLLAPVSGAGKGRFKRVALSLVDAPAGDHVITITTSGKTESGGHRIDYLKLAAIGKPARTGDKAH